MKNEANKPEQELTADQLEQVAGGTGPLANAPKPAAIKTPGKTASSQPNSLCNNEVIEGVFKF